MTRHPPDNGGPESAGGLGFEELTTRARWWIIAGNGARQLVVPFANFVVSYLVISAASAELWGAFVVRLVLVSLTVHVLAWGNHETLLRAFSREPQAMSSLWRRSLATRGVFLVLAVAGCIVLGLRGADLGWTVLWVVAALGYQSLAVVVLYTRRFGVAVAAELVGISVTAVLLVTSTGGLDLTVVTRAVAAGFAARLAVGLAAFGRKLLDGLGLSFDGRHLVEATPFFLTGLSGLLISKADLLVVTAVLAPAEVGAYQVLLSLFTAVQGLAAVAYTPFLRELYRAPDGSSRRGARILLAAGLGLAILAVPAAHLVLNIIYGLALAPGLLILGALYALPSFGYLPLVYSLYKRDREREVAKVSFVAAGITIVLTLVLARVLGMTGALAAATAAQWMLWGWYRFSMSAQNVSRSP
jgi:O-antigen/teichoic acid export membrane protein